MATALFFIQHLFWEPLLDLLRFPIWWYGRGFARVLAGTGHQLKTLGQDLGIAVWAKNLFVPMFGQYDIWGRIISFAVRLVQLIARSLVWLLWALLLIALALLWPLLPLVAFWGFFATLLNYARA